MNIEKVIETLQYHNDWRREKDGNLKMLDPVVIGQAIDEAILILKEYKETQKC